MHETANKIKELRSRRGFSQEELAARLDISPSYISRMESDLKKPSLDMIFRLAGALNIKPDELIKGMEG